MFTLIAANVDPTPLINATTFPAARYSNIGVLLGIIGPLLVTGAGLLCGGMLLYGAYTFLTAGSNAENVTKGKNIIVWAGIGLIVVVSATLMVRIIGTILNVNTVFDL
jgi:hypothetical protein